MGEKKTKLARRSFLTGAACLTGSFAIAQDTGFPDSIEIEPVVTKKTKRNISSFRVLDWRPYFKNLKNGAILSDISSRALHFWSEDEKVYRLYPTSVPISDDLTRKGRTRVVKK